MMTRRVNPSARLCLRVRAEAKAEKEGTMIRGSASIDHRAISGAINPGDERSLTVTRG